MLRLGKVGRGGQDYYLAVAAGSGTGIEPAGRWSGQGAVQLDLRGDVAAAALGAVLDGWHPGSAELLSETHNRVRVAAFDLTFCAPKSVSLLHALGDRDVAEAVRDCHEQAVAGALGYVERRAAAVRGPQREGRPPLPVDGLVTATFLHRTSRALDPHLHTHAVVANLASGAGRPWHALDGRGVFAHRAAADALYHAELRFGLTARLGVGFGPLHHGRADIEGIGPEVRGAFSQRAAAIAAELERIGHHGGHAAVLAAHTTRPSRRLDVGADDLSSWWRQRAETLGFGPSAIDRVLSAGPGQLVEDVGDLAARASKALSLAGRPVARRDAIAALCWSAPAGLPAATVDGVADGVLAAAARRVGVPVPTWGPGVAERRVDVGPARLAQRDFDLSDPSSRPRDGLDADDPRDLDPTARWRVAAERSDELLRRRLAARGMCREPLVSPDQEVGFDLGMG